MVPTTGVTTMLDTTKQLTTWHEGETLLQKTVGVADRMAVIGPRVIRDFMPEQHRDFYEQLPFVIAGAVDSRGNAWATVLAGKPGFISSPTPQTLTLEVRRDPRDPASAGLRTGNGVGLLGIELHTRRRNRVNGILRDAGTGALQLVVGESFGNCPQYIQLRSFRYVRDPAAPFSADTETATKLDAAARETIAMADTFFVASYAEREGRLQVDVSHRGGNAGFVRINADGSLTIPDYSGNLFFSTLGNIVLNGKAGLVFVDFETGDLLQLSGDARVILDSPEIDTFEGAERLWTFTPRHMVRRRNALPLRWSLRSSRRTRTEEAWSPDDVPLIDAFEPRPAVFLEPSLPMLRYLVNEGLRVGRVRPTIVFTTAPVDSTLTELAETSRGAIRVVPVTLPQQLDATLLRSAAPLDDSDFYVNGVSARASRELLRELAIADSRINM